MNHSWRSVSSSVVLVLVISCDPGYRRVVPPEPTVALATSPPYTFVEELLESASSSCTSVREENGEEYPQIITLEQVKGFKKNSDGSTDIDPRFSYEVPGGPEPLSTTGLPSPPFTFRATPVDFDATGCPVEGDFRSQVSRPGGWIISFAWNDDFACAMTVEDYVLGDVDELCANEGHTMDRVEWEARLSADAPQ